MTSLDIRVAFSAIDKFTRPVNAARNSAGGLSESIKKTQAAIKSLESQSTSFQKLRNSTNDTAQKLNKAQREAAGLSQRLKETGTLSDAQRAKLDSLRTKITTLSTAYSAQTAKLREGAQVLRQHGITLTSGSGAIQSAIRRTEQYNQTLERERRQLAAVTQARSRYDKMQQTAGNLRSTGTGAVFGAAAAGYASGRFLAPAVGFDEEMSRVQALTRLDKGDQQMGALRAQAKKLGAETAFTTQDAASGQAFLAMAGFTPQSIQAALPGVLSMALAGGMELGESADIGSNVLSQFSLDASQMDRVSDTLTAAFTRTNTDLRSLGETMKYAGPVASTLGISLEDAAAMAGMLANNGIRGSDAGTAMRASLSRLASPPKAAADALKELGVSVADAHGKMRPMQDVLLDLYKTTTKYGEADQVSFFKDIAGGQAFVGLQTLVQAAGSGALGKLAGELKNANGEATAVAKKMADNLSGDLKELDSAWEGFRIQIEETIDGPLRSLTQSLSNVINSMMEWAKENPELTQTLLLVGGGALALTAVIGATSLALGILMGPLAKLQLGFTLLTGGRGIGGTIAMFRTLGGVAGSSMTRIGGWSQVMKSLSAGFGRLPALLTPLRGILFAAFTSPLSSLMALGKSIGMLLLRLTGLPALWGLISGAASILGGALSLLLSPIGLIGAAFVAAGVLIWKYWEPIKAFFSGFFSGVMQALQPLRDTFASLSPVFDAIGAAVSRVWDWFKQLFTPIESSRESLEKCTSAGETFGRVLGTALNVLLWPLQKLMEGIGWVLEKLDLIPSGLEAARLKAESLKKDPVMWEWDEKQGKMVKKGWDWAPKSDGSHNPPAVTTPAPVLTGETGTQRRLQKIADNTGGLLDETKKRIGPGDIVFKNLPRAFTVQGAWQETRVSAQKVPRVVSQQMQDITTQPIRQGSVAPVSASPGAAPSFNLVFNDVGKQDPRELAQLIEQKIRQILNERDRNNRGSFRDQD
ncbi:phage tail tape measure protein [Brenneria roseae subsp. americana]|uniref:Phage tail tape measure protein n=1 Tax=Brenneria roseae subsp. americana TaxID=1508507 RepID=A0A2U1TJU5_9GAMM|nr:phage tail tape measure protein [Brenneria roseae]PWC09673.1 phage tail tape measure protein [Brenneria roseae subsp. americana]